MNVDIIKKARDTIANGNWWKGSARSDDCPEKVCAVTALGDACDDFHLNLDDREEVIQFVDRFAPLTKGPNLRPLAAFNDSPGTTSQDVVNVFDKALAELGELL